MNFKLLVLGAALTLPLPMLAGMQATSPPATNTEQLSSSDKLFLKALIQEDISEISLAKLALHKASDPQVKQYAQSKILAADPEMRNGAAQIAQAHHMTPPVEPNARQKQMYNQISRQSGKYFDNAYMNYEAAQQHADVQLVQTELASTQSPEMKSYLDKEKAPVQEAADSAKEISGKISSQMTNYRHAVRAEERK